MIPLHHIFTQPLFFEKALAKLFGMCYYSSVSKIVRRSGGMADASDSKSDAGNSVWVQVPSPALKNP